MTIAQVVNMLNKEKQEGITSRFPCRAIMVKNVKQYCELLSELQTIPDIEKVASTELFASADVMPRYENLKDAQYAKKWVILTGVSEYLRLFSRKEAETQRFAKLWSFQAAANNLGRVIIPLWGCEAQWHDHSLHLCEDIRQDDFYYDCSDQNDDDQQMNLLVLSGVFEQYLSQLASQNGQMSIGLQEWYEYWSNPMPNHTNLLLLTKRCDSIQPTTGNILIRVIHDTFSFVRENLQDGHTLTKDNCPTEAQNLLFEYALAGNKLDDAILSALNLASFTGIDVMSKWATMSDGQKQLTFLWFQRHNDGSYLSHCIQNSSSTDDVNNHILHDIFSLRSTHAAWVEESQKLIVAMKLPKDTLFFSELDKFPTYEERLQYLSGHEKSERIYLLRMIGKWLREDAVQVHSCKLLEEIYPELFAYLGSSIYDDDLGRYFSLYKSHKLENSLPTDEDLYFSGIQTDSYEFRYTVLSESVTNNCAILWVDALGAEWLPLLSWAVGKLTNGNVIHTAVAQATLPTETCFNEQWKQMDIPYKKLDRLDKLAHKGVIDEPDYYACVEDQMSFISSLTSKVNEMLTEYQRVIITGDHGTSRIAARFFHKRDGMPVPHGATVYSHGRYCKLSTPLAPQTYQHSVKDKEGNNYLVFTNYDHFIQSGFATGTNDDNAIYGEIHGGASPEEMLVPVIAIDSTNELPLQAKWQKNPVKIMMKKATLTIAFSRPVNNLQMKLGDNEGICNAGADKKLWTVVFSGVHPNTYHASIAADGVLVTADPIEIKSALGDGDGDLP